MEKLKKPDLLFTGLNGFEFAEKLVVVGLGIVLVDCRLILPSLQGGEVRGVIGVTQADKHEVARVTSAVFDVLTKERFGIRETVGLDVKMNDQPDAVGGNGGQIEKRGRGGLHN